MSEANNITFVQAKTSFFYRPKAKRKYNTLHLAGKEMCKKDEKNPVLFELNIKLLYGRYTKSLPFLNMGASVRFFILLSLFYQAFCRILFEEVIEKQCKRCKQPADGHCEYNRYKRIIYKVCHNIEVCLSYEDEGNEENYHRRA